MSLKIDRGLFKYDFIDYHAILGVSVDADVKDIRKCYLKIARRLHPDSNATASPTEKQQKSELLSKWVNPAYEKLSSDRTRAEYMVVLSQMGKRLVQESSSVELNTDLARQLASVPNVDHVYKSAIAKIAETQYDSLEKVLQIIAHISELNLVYLMRTAGKSFAASQQAAQTQVNSTASTTQNKTTNTASPPPVAAPKEESAAIQYLRRAQELLGKNQLAQARVELQDAIKLEPNNSRCHSLIGVVYLKQNQSTMAKVHFDRALQLDPNDETALKGKRVLEQALAQKPGGSKVTSSSNNGGKQSDKSGNGGLFGGLFGGKKK
ncbi:MAG: DnaJ domain-containing protein [Tolypothrix sp. T3-bin4]|nr:DnaJ domain-containing protein [Tolypothrix sp. Co-bin9]MBD0300809.1 DnaJ domain-containing protein [Tolypothrix sp. T3-bin4]